MHLKLDGGGGTTMGARRWIEGRGGGAVAYRGVTCTFLLRPDGIWLRWVTLFGTVALFLLQLQPHHNASQASSPRVKFGQLLSSRWLMHMTLLNSFSNKNKPRAWPRAEGAPSILEGQTPRLLELRRRARRHHHHPPQIPRIW